MSCELPPGSPSMAVSTPTCSPAASCILDLPASALSQVAGSLLPITQRQLRLTCKQLKHVVDGKVARLVIDSPAISPAAFPYLREVTVVLWRPGTDELDLLPLLCQLPRMHQLRHLRIKAGPQPKSDRASSSRSRRPSLGSLQAAQLVNRCMGRDVEEVSESSKRPSLSSTTLRTIRQLLPSYHSAHDSRVQLVTVGGSLPVMSPAHGTVAPACTSHTSPNRQGSLLQRRLVGPASLTVLSIPPSPSGTDAMVTPLYASSPVTSPMLPPTDLPSPPFSPAGLLTPVTMAGVQPVSTQHVLSPLSAASSGQIDAAPFMTYNPLSASVRTESDGRSGTDMGPMSPAQSHGLDMQPASSSPVEVVLHSDKPPVEIHLDVQLVPDAFDGQDSAHHAAASSMAVRTHQLSRIRHHLQQLATQPRSPTACDTAMGPDVSLASPPTGCTPNWRLSHAYSSGSTSCNDSLVADATFVDPVNMDAQTTPRTHRSVSLSGSPAGVQSGPGGGSPNPAYAIVPRPGRRTFNGSVTPAVARSADFSPAGVGSMNLLRSMTISGTADLPVHARTRLPPRAPKANDCTQLMTACQSDAFPAEGPSAAGPVMALHHPIKVQHLRELTSFANLGVAITELKLDIPVRLLATQQQPPPTPRPASAFANSPAVGLGALAFCAKLKKLSLNFLRANEWEAVQLGSSHEEEPCPAGFDVMTQGLSSSLTGLSLHGGVQLMSAGYQALGSLTALTALTLWIEEWVTDALLEPLSNCAMLTRLQVARLALEEPLPYPPLPQIRQLSVYVTRGCELLSLILPGLTHASLHDWPGITNPEILVPLTTEAHALEQRSSSSSDGEALQQRPSSSTAQGMHQQAVGLTHLVLNQHTRHVLVLPWGDLTPRIAAHMASIPRLQTLKCVTFKGFAHVNTVRQLCQAATQLPCLTHLTLVASGSETMSGVEKVANTFGGLTQLRSLSIDCQGGSWDVVADLLMIRLPHYHQTRAALSHQDEHDGAMSLTGLWLTSLAQTVTQKQMAALLARLPRLGHLELVGCKGSSHHMLTLPQQLGKPGLRCVVRTSPVHDVASGLAVSSAAEGRRSLPGVGIGSRPVRSVAASPVGGGEGFEENMADDSNALVAAMGSAMQRARAAYSNMRERFGLDPSRF